MINKYLKLLNKLEKTRKLRNKNRKNICILLTSKFN